MDKVPKVMKSTIALINCDADGQIMSNVWSK